MMRPLTPGKTTEQRICRDELIVHSLEDERGRQVSAAGGIAAPAPGLSPSRSCEWLRVEVEIALSPGRPWTARANRGMFSSWAAAPYLAVQALVISEEALEVHQRVPGLVLGVEAATALLTVVVPSDS